MHNLPFLQPPTQHPLHFLISTYKIIDQQSFLHPNSRRSLDSTTTSILQWDHPQDTLMRFSLILSKRTWTPTQINLFIPLFALNLECLVIFQVELVVWFWRFQFGVRFVIFNLRKRGLGFVKWLNLEVLMRKWSCL